MTNNTWAVRVYHSVFGSQWSAIPMSILVANGAEDKMNIYANIDGIRPSDVIRFKSQDEAEAWVEAVNNDA